jgi:hypothetical protein
MMNISNHSTHGTQSDHYRSLASEAMDSAAKTRLPLMRDGFLKLAPAGTISPPKPSS